MKHDTELSRLGVYNTRAPRYTSYPTAVHFKNDIGPDFITHELANLPADKPISLYVHIPFCERLCWFCACRTQGTKKQAPIENYLQILISEIELVARHLPDQIEIGKIHWGGGTPTILQPTQIKQLATALKAAMPHTKDVEFSVEIDPTLVNQEKIDALAEMGMTRASIGVQDFAPKVQNAIGRQQSFAITEKCIHMLRNANIHSLNMDILYGLPHQTDQSVLKTIDQVLDLSPDRIALYGYAHVPWMAKRQQLIDEAALPTGETRRNLFMDMADRLEDNGYNSIGIDHFAKANDSMFIAAHKGKLRRNFQGYTTDGLETLIGLGASAISKLPSGYAQNASKSSDYSNAIKGHNFATYRGVKMSTEDKLIARVIEMIMCDFEVTYKELIHRFRDTLHILSKPLLDIQKNFGDVVEIKPDGFKIIRHERELARMIAQSFDQYSDIKMRYSTVS